VSNIVGIIIQYFVGGGWGFFKFPSFKPEPQAPAAQQDSRALKEGTAKKKA
jgi:hypothetical protein